MARQVRVDDELCERLLEQGGSLTAACNRTLSWALDAMDAGEEPADDDDAYEAPAPIRRAARSSRAAAARQFATAVRRSF